MGDDTRQFITGYQAVVAAAKDAGAEMMCGYPITPATEVFSYWIKQGGNYLQTEDEIAAGFGVCGAVMAGQKAFTATAGPGHVLMQDALSMAEGMRLPFVAVVGQRGGPSSGTVIYSQQEVNLACKGGNGEGMRLVYSPSSIEELYTLTLQAFNDAWKYHFPAIVLTDGYLLKTKGVMESVHVREKTVTAKPFFHEGEKKHWRNIYTAEEELREVLEANQKDFLSLADKIAKAEVLGEKDADIVVVAHGIVGASAKAAVQEMRVAGKNVALFRPITLSPFPKRELNDTIRKAKKVVVVESSLGQLGALVKEAFEPKVVTSIAEMYRPAVGIEPQEIINFVNTL